MISSISNMCIATLTRMAATLGSGKNLKYGRKISDSVTKVMELMIPDTRQVAPLFTLSAVLARAAVAGMPPNIPANTFATESAKTSFR
jgi:hypothetical protein